MTVLANLTLPLTQSYEFFRPSSSHGRIVITSMSLVGTQRMTLGKVIEGIR
jgi:hypothetical protein